MALHVQPRKSTRAPSGFYDTLPGEPDPAAVIDMLRQKIENGTAFAATCQSENMRTDALADVEQAERRLLAMMGVDGKAYQQERARRSLLHAELLVNPDRYHRTTAETEYIFSLATTLEVTR